MPRFEPFCGVRYASGGDIAAVAAPPYDVVDDHEREVFESNSPHNSIRLILPRDVHANGDRYVAASTLLEQWLTDGTLIIDGTARFYGYRMDFDGPDGEHLHTLGVLGALAVPDVMGEAGVLPHERTIAKAKSDRLDLLRATRANLDPIWGLSLTVGFTALIDTSTPIAHCTDELGVTHTLFAIDNATTIAAITDAVAANPLVLADGHHRFETAFNYRNEQTAAGVVDTGADAIMALVVELAEDQLCIQAIHRLATLPSGFDARAALSDAFTFEPLDSLDAADGRGAVLIDATGMTLLVPIDTVVATALEAEAEAARGTDAAVVEHVIKPRWQQAEWVYRHDDNEIVNLVRNGTYSAGLVLRPATVATTRAAAFAGVRMPQKTTFFYPKPRTGMVFRTLDS